MKEIKQDLDKWRDLPCSWIGRLTLENMLIFSKVMYRFNATPIKTTAGFFCKSRQGKSNINRKGKVTRIAKTIFKKKNKIEDLLLSNLRLTITLQSMKQSRQGGIGEGIDI